MLGGGKVAVGWGIDICEDLEDVRRRQGSMKKLKELKEVWWW